MSPNRTTSPGVLESVGEPGPRSQPLYRRRACNRCVVRKTRCNSQTPCRSCELVGVACTYSFITRQPPKRPLKVRTSHTPTSSHGPGRNSKRSDSVVGDGMEPHPNSHSPPSPIKVTVSTRNKPLLLPKLPQPLPSTTFSLTGNYPTPELSSVSMSLPLSPLSGSTGGFSQISTLNKGPMELDNSLHLTTTDSSSSSGSEDAQSALADQLQLLFTEGCHDKSPGSSTTPVYRQGHNSLFSRAHVDQLLTDLIQRIHHLSTLDVRAALHSEEETIYHPRLVRNMVAVFANQQARLHRQLYLERLWRKVLDQQVTPLTLNYILATSAAAFVQDQVSVDVRRRVALMYLDRVEALLMAEFDSPSLDTPYLLLGLGYACLMVKRNDKYVYYSSLAHRLMVQLGFHQVDEPRSTDGVEDSQREDQEARVPPPFKGGGSAAFRGLNNDDDELIREYKRRSFWEIVYFEDLSHCLFGVASSLSQLDVQVLPIDDRLLEKILRLDPADDHYPAILPGNRVTITGYSYMLEFHRLVGQVADLRSKAGKHAKEPGSIRYYYHLNGQLRCAYRQICHHAKFPSLGVDIYLQNPKHCVSLIMLHTCYHFVVIMANTRNWSLNHDVVHPEQDPECHRTAMTSADFIIQSCVPLFKRLPTNCFTPSIAGSTFAAAYCYLCALATFYQNSSPPDFADKEEPRRMVAVLRGLMQLLHSFGAYLSYADYLLTLLRQLFHRYRIPTTPDGLLPCLPSTPLVLPTQPSLPSSPPKRSVIPVHQLLN
ncbi:hypothetical protein IWQ61_005697 [Dispira simplex]|nr:hypothetical protein IWQ61_005697 [Dispira simplex]